MLMCRHDRPQFHAMNIVLLSILSLFHGGARDSRSGAGNPTGITGVVTDNSGAVLPGVTVTATSRRRCLPSPVSPTSGASTAYPRCRLAYLPSSSSCRAFRTSGARGCD
jgi:hypothetical protein